MTTDSNTYTRVHHLIGGELAEPSSGRYFPSFDPATDEPWAEIAEGNEADVELAIEAGAAAFESWRSLSLAERCRYVERLADAVEAHADEFAAIECRDVGTTLGKARADAINAATAIRFFLSLKTHLTGEAIPLDDGVLHYTTLQPFGIVARIIPFNHPLTFAASKVAAPLIAGNVVVVKPPEQASVSMDLFGRLCAEILPPGTVGIVNGYGSPVGDTLVRHRLVRRIAFTGSARTGLRIMQSAAESGYLKDVSLELGGKNPLVLLDDVNIEDAAQAAVNGMSFAWQGQSCGSTSLLLAHENIAQAVTDRVVQIVSSMKLGPPADPSTQMGPLVSREHRDRVVGHIERAIDEGAKLLTGGGRPPGAQFERGYWIEPTVFGNVDASMAIARDEVFGPVLSILTWSELDELYEIANSSDYGLTAAVWGTDLSKAIRVAERIHTGYVWVNMIGAKPLGVPYGGVKNSGIGRESSAEELLSFVQTKSMNIHLGGA